jgi:hypothetical protein
MELTELLYAVSVEALYRALFPRMARVGVILNRVDFPESVLLCAVTVDEAVEMLKHRIDLRVSSATGPSPRGRVARLCDRH